MFQAFFLSMLALTATSAQGPAKDSKQPAATATKTPASTAEKSVPSANADAASEVPPDQPVITVHGLCSSPTANKQDCVTKVTKQEFDTLIKAINPESQAVTPAIRKNLAQRYVELLQFAAAAKASGVESSPAYQEVLHLRQLQAMADFYGRQLQEQFHNPSQADVDAYYQSNKEKYEEVKLARIYLPKNNPSPQGNGTPEQKAEYDKKVHGLVDTLLERASKGEDMDKLQKEGYTTLGISSAPPTTSMSPVRKGMFPPKQDQDIFSHKAGEAFRTDDGSGYLIYRVVSREVQPLETVKKEVVEQLFRQKIEAKRKEITSQSQPDFDEKYFGPAQAATSGAPAPSSPK